jgi:IS1 transposase
MALLPGTQKALPAVRLSIHPYNPAREATDDEDQCCPVVPQRHVYAPHYVPPLGFSPGWIRDCAKDRCEKRKPMGRTIVLVLDEMWHSLKNKRRKLWIWKALGQDTGQLLDWECGRRDKATLKKMVDRLAQWDVKMYCTDKWATYASITPQDKLVQTRP